MNNVSFRSTRIPMTSKIAVTDYFKVLPRKDYKSFHNRTVSDCLYDLHRTDNLGGILWGKDRCFYIFGNNKSQDDLIYSKLKKLDSNVTHVNDVK